MIVTEFWKSARVLDKSQKGCVHCGASVVELGSEYSSVLANVPKESPFHGKVPYQCKQIACGLVVYAPSLNHPKTRCCF